MGKADDVQIYYADNGVVRQAAPVAPTNSNPIKQVIDVMKKSQS